MYTSQTYEAILAPNEDIVEGCMALKIIKKTEKKYVRTYL